MATVFLSYSHQDQKRVSALAVALQEHGHQVWWDRHIRGGAEYSAEIEQALKSADSVVVVWTKRSVKSHWVRDEAGSAREDGRLIPVALDAVDPPLGFRQFQTIDLSTWNGHGSAPALEPLLLCLAEREKGADGQVAQRQPQQARRAPMFRSAREWLRPGIVAGLLAIMGVAGYQTFVRTDDASAKPQVHLGQVSVITPNVPKGLADALRQDAISAFSVENAVTVMVSGYSLPSGSRDYLLSATIGAQGDKVRFAFDLKNGRTGSVVWADTFERPLQEASASVNDVALSASQIVRCGLGSSSYHDAPLSDDALAAYFKYCDAFWSGSGSPEGLLEAARNAVAAAPDFSFAWSARGLAALMLAESGHMDREQLRQEAAEAADQALKLNPSNPEGYLIQSALLPITAAAKREALLKKAVGALPLECGCERQWYGDFLRGTGRARDSLDQIRRGHAMQPLAPFSNARLALALYSVGRSDEAEQVLAKAEALWPDAAGLRLVRIRSAMWNGKFADAAKLLAASAAMEDETREVLVSALEALASGSAAQKAAAADALERVSRNPRGLSPLVVLALGQLGRGDVAVAAAERLVKTGGPDSADVLFEPGMDSARAAPAFAQFAERNGLIGYWKASGVAPDFCHSAGAPAICSRL